jgi:hypothetical protein
MVWVKVDDDFPQHPKARKAGPVGMALWLAGLCYSSHYLTDGLVPVEVLSGLLPLEKKEMTRTVDKLVFSGLWSVAEGGYEIHDYLQYQMSKQEVLMQRQVAQRRGAMNRDVNLTAAIRSRDGDHCRYCGITVNWKDRKSPTGGTYDHVVPISKGGDESLANIVVACRGCNMSKGPRTPEEANLILLLSGQDLAGINPGSSRNQPQNPDKTPTPIPTPEEQNPPIGPPLPEQGTAPAKRRGSGIPSNWTPSETLATWGNTKHPTVDLEAATEEFLNHAEDKGRTTKSIEAAWRNWIIKAEEWGPHKPGTTLALSNGNGRSQNQINADAVARRHGLNPRDTDPFGTAPNEPWRTL